MFLCIYIYTFNVYIIYIYRLYIHSMYMNKTVINHNHSPLCNIICSNYMVCTTTPSWFPANLNFTICDNFLASSVKDILSASVGWKPMLFYDTYRSAPMQSHGFTAINSLQHSSKILFTRTSHFFSFPNLHVSSVLDDAFMIVPSFYHHLPTMFPPFSHHVRTIFPSCSHHIPPVIFPIVFPPGKEHQNTKQRGPQPRHFAAALTALERIWASRRSVESLGQRSRTKSHGWFTGQ